MHRGKNKKLIPSKTSYIKRNEIVKDIKKRTEKNIATWQTANQ